MNGSVNPDALLDVDLAATVFDIIRDIKDPERPENLSQLGVICEEDICVAVTDGRMDVKIVFTPTVPHCHLATLIGLCITAKLARDFPHKYKLHIGLKDGSHLTGDATMKQINDKERLAAALENESLRRLVDECIQ